MRRRLALLAASALAAAAALLARRRRGAAEAPLPAGTTPPPLPGPAGTTPPPPPSPAARPEPGVAGPEPEPALRFVSVPWSLAGPAPPDRPHLTVRARQTDALALDRVDVQETPTQVFLTALARREPLAPGDPPRAEAEVVVRLSGPLGARELIPAPVDEAAGPADAPPL